VKIAVASGKVGIGKTMFFVNLDYALAERGPIKRTGRRREVKAPAVIRRESR